MNKKIQVAVQAVGLEPTDKAAYEAALKEFETRIETMNMNRHVGEKLAAIHDNGNSFMDETRARLLTPLPKKEPTPADIEQLKGRSLRNHTLHFNMTGQGVGKSLHPEEDEHLESYKVPAPIKWYNTPDGEFAVKIVILTLTAIVAFTAGMLCA